MFYLTSQERKTIIFILVLIFLGIGLDFLKKGTNSQHLFNYQAIQQNLAKKVDINKATLSELSAVTGISERLAKDIIEYRNSQGGFKNIEELKNIKGIKDKKLESLRKYLTIEPKSP